MLCKWLTVDLRQREFLNVSVITHDRHPYTTAFLILLEFISYVLESDQDSRIAGRW